jgi:Domain of unknown function (DUF4124)
MRALVFTLMCIATCQTAISATVYKWVDADGVTHYTDQPHPGAQKIQLQGAQTYSAAAAQRGPSAAAAQASRRTTTSAPANLSCEVTRPTNDEVFVNASSVPASVHVDPGLRSGDRLTVMLDGAPLPVNTPVDTEFVLSSVVRGTHSLTTKVEDATGAVVCQSASVIFHVRQPSVLAPNQANRPH